jgi:spermidine synthase
VAFDGIVARVDSDHAPILVFEQDGYRLWCFEDNPRLTQGAQSLSNPLDFRFEYVRQMAATLAFPAAPRRLLVLGLGAGAVPRLAQALVPGIQVDVVEIDPAVLEVATVHFGFEVGESMRVFVDDAAGWVHARARRRGVRYDAIHLDCFDAHSMPPTLTTPGFLADLGRLLQPGGVVAANLVHTHRGYRTTLRRWVNCFGGLWLMAAPTRTNRVPVGAALGTPDVKGALERARSLDRASVLTFSLETELKRGRPHAR